MELLENFFRYSHIFAGVVVLLTGILAILVKPRGSHTHKKVGITYFYGMLWIFITSLGMNYFKFNFFLTMISVFSFYLCFSAYRTLKRKTPDIVNWMNWTGSIITLLCGLVFLGYGLLAFIQTQNPFAFISFFFGGFTAYFALQDIQIFQNKIYDDKMWWYFQHSGMNWVYWVLPTIIGTPLLTRIVNNEKLN